MDRGARRAATSIELLVTLGTERGADPDALLGAAGLDRSALAAADAEVTAGQELAVARALVRAVDDPALGVEAGLRYHLTTYGIWGFALISSPTLRAAVDVGRRYLELTYALTRIDVEVGAGEVQLRFATSHLPADVAPFLVDRDATAVRVVQRELLGGLPPVEVALRRPEPEDPGPWLAAFGDDAVRFGADGDAMWWRGAALDLPLPRADVRTAALAAAQCEQLLQRRRALVGVAGEVRQRLSAAVGQPPTLRDLADERHVTDRTLRRQLAAEGTSYRALLDEVRVTLADELLVVAGLPVDQVAHRLGYADAPAFTKAFRRWTGTTPAAYRTARR